VVQSTKRRISTIGVSDHVIFLTPKPCTTVRPGQSKSDYRKLDLSRREASVAYPYVKSVVQCVGIF
jgi:hypothetical protein